MRSIRTALFLLVAPWCCLALPVDYDLIYVRQPRFGDNSNTTWPEVFHPARIDPGADLMLRHPDGSEEVLVAGGDGAVTDPFLSFDAQWCYYVLFPNVQQGQLNYQRDDLPYQGCDIYRIHLATREIVRLTDQEFTPNLASGNWDESDPLNNAPGYNYLGYGILNLGPCPLPGGRVAFSSNRDGYLPNKSFTSPCLQLYVMDEDGQNVVRIAPMNIGSALHPTVLQDGRFMFSSYEAQGLRDRRLWGIWSINPDGRAWQPMVSAFHSPQAFHFMTQLGNGDVIVTDYYNLNNNGFGAFYRMPYKPPPGTPAFYSAYPADNPAIDQTVGGGFSYPFKMPFTPYGMYSITPFTHGQDHAAPVGTNGVRVGKFTQPSAAPSNDLLCVWTPGPANDLNRPTPAPYYDSGIYLIPGGDPITGAHELVEITNDPNYNEAWPRAVVPYAAIHGIAEPEEIPWLPNDGTLHRSLPEGTPFGIVGTSSFYKRESFPGNVVSWSDTFDGLDAFNTSENGQSGNWSSQGSDAGRYSNADIFAVRILAMEANTHRSYGPHAGQQFFNHANERLRILGEIPLRKYHSDGSPVLDPEGNPDTSFQARIPADTPFTFQMLDHDGAVLTTAQTWHQLRPGEIRNDCGGCHAHSQQPLDIADTRAGQPEYRVVELTDVTTWLSRIVPGEDLTVTTKHSASVNVEFYQDIRPILQRSCTPCHTQSDPTPPGNLVLDELAFYGGLPGDYKRLADDTDAQWGYPPLVTVGGNPVWRQTNASRYIRKFQSRRSLLTWKVFGRRMDGWTNGDHPTETTPGDAGTLVPPGSSINEADLDFTGTIMPPPGTDPAFAPRLSEDEKLLFVRWIDLGCPIDTAQQNGNSFGWFLDDHKPTLTVSSPRPNFNPVLTEIRIGVADAYSGIDAGSLSVIADFPVNETAPGIELAGMGSFVNQGIFSIQLVKPLINLTESHVTVTVFDQAGNKQVETVRFNVIPPGEDLSIVHLDLNTLSTSSLILRFRDSSADLDHRVLASDDLSLPLNQWTECSQLGYQEEGNDIRLIEFTAPAASASGSAFIRVVK